MTEWRPVVGYEGLYEVSDTGRVRSLDRRVNSRWNGTRVIPGRELKPYVSYDGYTTFSLRKNPTSKNNIKASRLVAEAFVPRVQGKDWVLHNDGDPQNNVVSNLRWGTPKENAADRFLHGTSPAFRTHCRKGHEFSEENTRYRSRKGGKVHRVCITCDRNTRKVSGEHNRGAK